MSDEEIEALRKECERVMAQPDSDGGFHQTASAILAVIAVDRANRVLLHNAYAKLNELEADAANLVVACKAVLSVLQDPLSQSVGLNRETFHGDRMRQAREVLRAALADRWGEVL